MRIASLKSRTARSRSPLRVARVPFSRSAVTLALMGFMSGVLSACAEVAPDAAFGDMTGAASCGSGAPYGTASRAATSPGDIDADGGIVEGVRPEVISMRAATPASQGGSVSDFCVSGSVLARPVSRVQALRSEIDPPLPHAADVVAVGGALDGTVNSARIGPTRVGPWSAGTRAASAG